MMAAKKLSNEQVRKMESVVRDGLYAIPGSHKKSNDNETKKIIEKMKNRESSSFQETTKI